ncbi:MAG: hypothetical protein IJY39_08410 [Clostridia bacterium]|nr:hypothetical protein [Clostridia bacterium]
MKKLRRILLSTLALCMGLAAAVPADAASGDENIVSDAPALIAAYHSSLPGRSAKEISTDYCIRLNLGAPFNSVSISMPTWSTSDSSATISIYKWSGDYSITVLSDPLATKRYTALKDNSFNTLSFDELPAGEYLIRIHDVDGRVGVWHMNKTVSKAYCYESGLESEFDWEMKINFTKTPKEPFLTPVGSGSSIDGNHKPPEEYVIPEDSLLNTHKVMPDTWVFTDGLGRESLTYEDVGGPREGKTLAMFYWTWHTKATASKGAVNTTELMKLYPDAKNDYDHPAWEETGHYCFWNEPIYGFYNTEDPWVLRRHAELLANAGVDTIFTDNTNGSITWRESYLELYETWSDAQENGAVDVPKVSFHMPFAPTNESAQQIRSIYLDIYRSGEYQNLWFYYDDKPMLLAHNNFTDQLTMLDKEINRFFTWRAGQPGYLVESTAPKQWGWLSTYPQALYSVGGSKGVAKGDIEQMTVGVAVNHNYVTHELTAMNGEHVMGRSYTSTYPDRYEKEGTSASLWGYNFSEQFDYALEVDPEVIFITGWNEWHAWRQPTPWGSTNSMVSNALADQFDNEFSRDLEPTKGELKDHYYYLLVNYVRRYKGVNPIPTPSKAVTIDLGAGEEQWKSVEPYFAAYIGNTGDRDSTGYGDLVYTETSGRNDIIGAQVARDSDYIYFHVECAENITPYTDPLWMTLYIDSDQENQGWETFDYVINKSAAGEKTVVLERFTGEGYASEKVADCEYTLDGRYMTVKVAKADLALSGYDFTVNFAWTDNVHDEGDYSKFSGDIMDFYISGDVAPGARFKYSYTSTTENADVAELSTDPSESESVSMEESTAIPQETDTEITTDKKGCGSTLAATASAAVTATVSAAVVLGKGKRKKKN